MKNTGTPHGRLAVATREFVGCMVPKKVEAFIYRAARREGRSVPNFVEAAVQDYIVRLNGIPATAKGSAPITETPSKNETADIRRFLQHSMATLACDFETLCQTVRGLLFATDGEDQLGLYPLRTAWADICSAVQKFKHAGNGLKFKWETTEH